MPPGFMYRIKFTKSYKKSFKRLLKSGKHAEIKELEKVITALATGKKLGKKHKNHYLSGNLSKFQECHIKSDLLLIYYKEEDSLDLVLVDVGSHGDLFK